MVKCENLPKAVSIPENPQIGMFLVAKACREAQSSAVQTLSASGGLVTGMVKEWPRAGPRAY